MYSLMPSCRVTVLKGQCIQIIIFFFFFFNAVSNTNEMKKHKCPPLFWGEISETDISKP